MSMNQNQLFKSQLNNQSLEANIRLGSKVFNQVKLDCKNPVKLNFSKLYVKYMKGLKLENLSKYSQKEVNKIMLFTKKYSKYIKNFSCSGRDILNFRINHLSKLESIDVDLDYRRNIKNMDSFQIYKLFRVLTLSPHLKSLKISPFSWKNCSRLRRYQNLLNTNLTSSFSDFIKESHKFEDRMSCKRKFSNLNYALELLIESNEKIRTLELPRPLEQGLKSLIIKNNGNSEIDSLFQNVHLHKNLQNFSYIEQGHAILKKAQLLNHLSSFLKLKKLEVEFWVGPNDQYTVFDNFFLPKNLCDLKLTFSNCRFTMLEETKISQAFFRNLSDIKNLESFEFDAFRLSLLKEAKETCTIFIKNVMASINNNLSSLKIRGPPSKEIDDEFYLLLLKFRRLSVLDLGLSVDVSDEVAKKFSDYRGNFKSLSLHSNFSYFLNVAKSSLKDIEDLTLYFGLCIPTKGSMKSALDLIRIMDRIKNLTSLRKLTIFYSLSVEDKELKNKLFFKLQEILEKHRSIESMSITMRAMIVDPESKEKIEVLCKRKKGIKSSILKFQNIDILK